MKRRIAILSALVLFSMNGCAKAAQEPTAPAVPTGATMTIPLTHSCKAEPVADDADLRDGMAVVRGDKIILASYTEEDTCLGLYDTVTGTLTKTTLGLTMIDGFDWRDGRLTILSTLWHGTSCEREYLIFDEALQMLETRPVTEEWSSGDLIYDWRCLSDGTQAVLTSGGFYLYDEANGCQKVSSDGMGNIVLSPDGGIWIAPNGEQPKRLDRETLTFEPLQIEDLPLTGHSNGGYYDGFGEYALLCTDNTALYGLKPETGEKEELVSFANSDLVDASNFAPLPDGRFVARSVDYLTFGSEYLLLTPRTQEECDNMRTLTLAAFSFDQEMQSRIARFNRQADDCRLVLKSYYDGSEDYDECRQAYYNDLLTGNIPDIMLIDQDYQMLSNKGLFEDMRPWMEQDPDFHEEDYLMNIFEAFGYRGRLERIPWCFYVQCSIAKTEFVGDRTNLTPDELFALELPEGMCYLNSGMDKTWVCWDFLISVMGDFVDYENAACSFDSEEFVSLLRLADTIPTGKLPEGDYCYRENSVLLYNTWLASLDEFHSAHEVVFGNADITLCGIGCDGGAAMMPAGIAVSALSAEKEAAWEFVKFNLQEEQQYSGKGVFHRGFPINRRALDSMLTDDTLPHDEQNTSSIVMNDEVVKYGAATQEELAYLRSVLDSIHTGQLPDMQIRAIVTEEAGRFFAGDCTAEEAAKAIQGRAGIYLAEQS